jgi:hypothetical protein
VRTLRFVRLRNRNGASAAPVPSISLDTIYGHFFDRVIPTGAKPILEASVARYLAAIHS